MASRAKCRYPQDFPNTEFHNLAFDSPAAVLAEVERSIEIVKRGGRNALPTWTGRDWLANETHRNEWYGGTKSLGDLKRVMREGWPEGCLAIARLRAQADGLVERVRERAESVHYDVAGQWLDVGRFVVGEPECFGYMAQAPLGTSQSKVIRVDLNVGVNAAASAEAFLARGAAVGALCDILEAAGRRVEIYTVAASVHIGGVPVPPQAKSACNIRIRLKDANEPLDFSRIAVAMAHVGFHRRVVLSLKQAIGQDPDGNQPCPYRYEALPDSQSHWRDPADAIIVREMNLRYREDWKPLLLGWLRQIGVSVDRLFD